MLDDLALPCNPLPAKSSGMSIHSEIKRRREAKGWSQQRLADEVSKAEGLKKNLTWQAVQQWEREPSAENGKSTAPRRSRLEIVAHLLDAQTVDELLQGAPDAKPIQFGELSGHEGRLVALFRLLSTEDQAAVISRVEERVTPLRKRETAAA